jgi:hypothetical protein
MTIYVRLESHENTVAKLNNTRSSHEASSRMHNPKGGGVHTSTDRGRLSPNGSEEQNNKSDVPHVGLRGLASWLKEKEREQTPFGFSFSAR